MSDRTQAGIVEASKEKLDELKELPYFEDGQTVYRLSVAVAITMGISVEKSLMKQPIKTMWRTQDDQTGREMPRLDDRKGTLAQMIQCFVPEHATEPYRHSQYLATLGINYLHKKIIDEDATPSEAIEDAIRSGATRVEESAS